jgi:hypothetical protein
VIGPANRTAAYGPKLEQALFYTAAGQADYAVPNSPHSCGGCVHFRLHGKSKSRGRCAEYQRLMNGKAGHTLSTPQTACRRFFQRRIVP